MAPPAEGKHRGRGNPPADHLHLRIRVDTVAVALHPCDLGKQSDRIHFMAKHIGFIGLGNMGKPMASRLLDAGYQLTVHDVRRESAAALAAKGARIAASPAALASAVDTLLLSLPNPAIVREAGLGKEGVAAGSKVKTVIDLSTTG